MEFILFIPQIFIECLHISDTVMDSQGVTINKTKNIPPHEHTFKWGKEIRNKINEEKHSVVDNDIRCEAYSK